MSCADDPFSFTHTLIHELPTELLISIFSFMPGDEIMRAERVCKYWKKMIHYIDESRERFLELRGNKRRKKQIDLSKERTELSRAFWIAICEAHFKDAMLLRRKYPSRIQPVTFYVYNSKIDMLRNIYSLEKSISSLEQALESESSLFSDVCIFSVDLMEMFTKLHKIDRYYNGQRLDDSDFEKTGLEFATHFYPLLNEYRKTRDYNKLIRFVALIRLNEANIGKKLAVKLLNAQMESEPWSPGARQRRHDENIREIERELLQEKLDVETLEDFGRDEMNLAKTYDSQTLSQVLRSSSSLDQKLNELYRAWSTRWRKVLLTRPQYSQFYRHIDLQELDFQLITTTFTTKNGNRYANGTLQRRTIYSKFLQHKLV
jgi:hypothetical protein